MLGSYTGQLQLVRLHHFELLIGLEGEFPLPTPFPRDRWKKTGEDFNLRLYLCASTHILSKGNFVLQSLEFFNLRKDAILLFTLFLLVVSVSDQTVAPIDVATQEPLDFVLSQTEMPIYELVTPDVNLTYAEDLAFSLFGIRDPLAGDVEGLYVINSGNKSFELDSMDGSLWYADYAKLWNISLDIGETTPSECNVAADEWLAEKGLFPMQLLPMLETLLLQYTKLIQEQPVHMFFSIM